jgi:rhamnogalacturonan endolyase
MLLAGTFFAVWSAKAAQAPERLDRGLVAMVTAEGKIYLGWRLLITDPAAIACNVYRSTAGGKPVRLNRQPITQSTNFLDDAAPLDRKNAWWVKGVVNARLPRDHPTLW